MYSPGRQEAFILNHPAFHHLVSAKIKDFLTDLSHSVQMYNRNETQRLSGGALFHRNGADLDSRRFGMWKCK